MAKRNMDGKMRMSLGNMIDALTIVNIKIWMAEDIKRKPDASDTEIANATRVTNVANQQRNDLIQSIDETINQMVSTGQVQKLYGQGSTKIYGKK